MTPVELPVLPAPTAAAAPLDRVSYARVARRVRLLSWLSLGWMTVEGVVAIAAGIVASSIALVGFGLDSGIEGIASVIIIWRFTGSRMFSHVAEQRAQKLVAVQFFLLAPYVGYESVMSLANAERPEVSWVGVGLAIGSVIFMPMLGIAKERLADQIGSAATKGEGRQNMLCAYLAAALLVGLIGNALLGAWWLDPLVGLLIAAVAVREGIEAWRGEGCCVGSPLDDITAEPCADDCCAERPAAPSCSLSPADLARQQRRYAEIGRAAIASRRFPSTIEVDLSEDVDDELVRETLEIERSCCPFFELDFDADRRVLSIGVADDFHRPALDAIDHALGG